jgi:hypothetical protein
VLPGREVTPRALPRQRTSPERSRDFDHLSLDALRAYRHALTAEEGKVSYWRRILQARLDVVRLGDGSTRMDVTQLGALLTEERVSGGRKMLIEILPVDDIPPLPNLAGLWRRSPVPGATAANEELAHDLAVAEAELSAYRLALHRRLAAATGELIARYREEPALCLSALPLRRSGARSGELLPGRRAADG